MIKNPRSYSLSMLFVVVALMAALTTMIGAAVGCWRDSAADPVLQIVTMGGTSLAGAVVGSLVGLHQHRRLEGALLGMLSGCLVGSLAGLLLVVNVRYFGRLLTSQLAGSLLMLATSALALWSSNDPLARSAAQSDGLGHWGAAAEPERAVEGGREAPIKEGEH
jgi:hypothetical protein